MSASLSRDVYRKRIGIDRVVIATVMSQLPLEPLIAVGIVYGVESCLPRGPMSMAISTPSVRVGISSGVWLVLCY